MSTRKRPTWTGIGVPISIVSQRVPFTRPPVAPHAARRFLLARRLAGNHIFVSEMLLPRWVPNETKGHVEHTESGTYPMNSRLLATRCGVPISLSLSLAQLSVQEGRRKSPIAVDVSPSLILSSGEQRLVSPGMCCIFLYRSIPSTKISRKVPKKEHKAMREKMKRDHLNDLFLELGEALVKVVYPVDAHTVTEEKNELQDEKNVLKAEVEKLQNVLHEGMQSDPMAEWHSKSDLAPPTLPQSLTAAMPMQQQPVGPLIDIALHQDLNPLPDATTSPPSPAAASKVSRPHARYPTPADTWSLELLSRNQRAAHEAQHGSGSTSDGRVEGLDDQ
ncbi:hypothetical protein BHE74_00030629 [Ensete ventricosum]|nr:hypothetical protein GW17_00050230 [Ensete ventricosum]RWW62263.1 hypothetical protein BHE74_00030629 [Ensete ventricosum]